MYFSTWEISWLDFDDSSRMGGSSLTSCPSPSNCRAWYLLRKGTWRGKETRRRFSPCPQQRLISFYLCPSSRCLLPGERVQDTPCQVWYLANIFLPERTAGFHQSAPFSGSQMLLNLSTASQSSVNNQSSSSTWVQFPQTLSLLTSDNSK